jgi:hypothetical protein
MEAGRMSSAEIAVLLFFAADLAAVVGGLFLLHRQRCIDDITDLRYRNHPDRARRTLGR